MSEAIDHQRRRLLRAAAASVVTAQLGMVGRANAQGGNTTPTRLPAIKPGTNTSFAALRQIDAGLLKVGYAEAGPSDGRPVILLHG